MCIRDRCKTIAQSNSIQNWRWIVWADAGRKSWQWTWSDLRLQRRRICFWCKIIQWIKRTVPQYCGAVLFLLRGHFYMEREVNLLVEKYITSIVPLEAVILKLRSFLVNFLNISLSIFVLMVQLHKMFCHSIWYMVVNCQSIYWYKMHLTFSRNNL